MKLADLSEKYDSVQYFDFLDREADIPVVSNLATQGDVLFIRRETNPATTPIPVDGFPVVKGENGGHTHAVFGKGFYTPHTRTSSTDLKLGVLTVPENELVQLSHLEHGDMLILPGTYEFRRQREMADQIRLVQD